MEALNSIMHVVHVSLSCRSSSLEYIPRISSSTLKGSSCRSRIHFISKIDVNPRVLVSQTPYSGSLFVPGEAGLKLFREGRRLIDVRKTREGRSVRRERRPREERGRREETRVIERSVVGVRAAGGEGEKPANPKAPAGKIPLESRRPLAPIVVPERENPPVFVFDEYIPRKKPRQFPLYKRDGDDEAPPPALGGMGPNHRSGYVALIGRPNAGKSTLLNQLVGQKLSIVTQKPQTTRHRILGICSGRKYQMIVYDTPGVMAQRMHKLDEVMMKNVRNAAVNADCIVLVVDISMPPQQVMDMLEEAEAAAAQSRPLLLVLNKKDMIKPGEVAKKMESYKESSNAGEVMAISAKYGHGCAEVREWALSQLPLGPAYYPKDIVSEHPERFFVAEIVREKILLQYQKEIPYVSQVNVLTYIERDGRAKDFVELEIVVEREPQKYILVGKGGNALKALATASRLEIEEFVGRPIFLEIRVKVKENWRQDEKLLHTYGLDSKQMQ